MRSSLKALLVSSVMMASMPAFAATETFKLDASHTAVTFQVTHMGFSHPTGKFMNIDGTLVLDEAKPDNSKLDVTIPVDKLESGVPKLDEHLKNKDFFEVEKFPTATFKSTKVVSSGKTAKVTGDLTLHGVTKPVVLDVTLNNVGEHPMTKKKWVGFSATTTIKRSDFGMNTGIPMVSDEVKLSIESEAGIVDGKEEAKPETKADKK